MFKSTYWCPGTGINVWLVSSDHLSQFVPLKPQGHALIALKQGQGRQEADDGRMFYLWDKEDLFSMFQKMGLICRNYSPHTEYGYSAALDSGFRRNDGKE